MKSLYRWAGSAVRALYLRLPLRWNSRLAAKDWIFRHCAPLLRHTNAYRRWQAFGGGSGGGPESAAVASLADAAAPVASPLQRYTADLLQRAGVGHGPDHVALRADAPPRSLQAKAIAFYLPQFHPIPENDAWWGKGFTEWTNVSKAMPQFIGHDQPKLPGELGFYDLRVPDVMRRQVELATLYGVHGFCFHYYWFSGRRLLERPLTDFIASDIEFPFCLCWANENWTRRWDGHEHDVLLGQVYSDDNDEAFIRDLAPYLRDRRYIRIDGRPLVVVYRPSLLPDCRRTLEHWRDYCREHGIGEICLAMVQFDVEDPRVFGFDVAIEFPPHKLASHMPSMHAQLEFVNPDYQGYVVDYDAFARRAMQWPEPDYAMFRGVSPGWDNEARKPGKGYTFFGNTPRTYRAWLESAVSFARRAPVQGESVVFINAWNEWAEGAYLEPDRRHGYAYLQATREALEKPVEAAVKAAGGGDARRVALVSHDAHPHGAQYLALALTQELVALGFKVELVLLGEGVLADAFAAAAHAVHRVDRHNAAAMDRLAARLADAGVAGAIANTTVAGDFVAALAGHGVRAISLVHELPGVIEQYDLAPQARAIAANASQVVFAAPEVRVGFERYAPLAAAQARIRPQGLYKRNALVSQDGRQQARQRLRAKLGLDADARVVLGVGYADLRKGADCFVAIGRQVMASDPRAHFAWVGHPDLALQEQLSDAIARSGFAGRFHFVGRDPDTDMYYAGADLYALTSREDPYPSVVMEAFDAGLPVVGFRGAGGFDALIERLGGGLVAMGDSDAFAQRVTQLLADPARSAALGAQARDFVQRERSFRHYAFDLLDMLGIGLPRVSVVVPNYNYARYLPERLQSIAGQSLPPYEIIVLDDASSDDSRAVIDGLQHRHGLRVVVNARNSGSVFRQWLKGVELATGDYVWIAEADDLSEPGFLETVLRAFADPAVVMSYCQSQQIDADGALLAGDYLDYVADISTERWRSAYVADGLDEVRNGMAVKNTIPNVSAVVFRRDALLRALAGDCEQIAQFRIAGDWLTYLRLLERGSVAFEPAALNKHRRHASGVTLGAHHSPHLREVLRVQKIARERYRVAEAEQPAWDYADQLYRQFGLSTREAPTLGDCRDLMENP
jgi:glycosyltransferase involved in cell wall biosynthesis